MGSLECTFLPTFLLLFLHFPQSGVPRPCMSPLCRCHLLQEVFLIPSRRTHLIVSFYLLLGRFYPSALCLEPLLACSSPPLDQQLIGSQAWSDTCYLSPAFPLPSCWALWSAATGGRETGFACALQHIHRCLATTILTWVLETKGTLGVAHFHPSLPTGGHRKTSHTSALPFNVPECTQDTLFLSSCGK